MSEEHKKLIGNLLSERSQFILIGLTGRTGSGCTTAAGILEMDDPSYPVDSEVKLNDDHFFRGYDRYRYDIVQKYASVNHHSFFSIKVSDLISAYILNLEPKGAERFVMGYCSGGLHLKVGNLFSANSYLKTKLENDLYKGITRKILNHEGEQPLSQEELSRFILYITLIRKYTSWVKNELNNIDSTLYLKVYQAAGNSIRKLGCVSANFDGIKFEPNSLYHLPTTVNKVVKNIRKIQSENGRPAYIAIDAIRNPYEAKFFKDRYANFYLISINAPNADRKSYLQKVHKYSVDQFDDLEKRESGDHDIKNSDFISQNVQRCIEISDIHIFNPRKESGNHNVLKAQLAWYMALMQHPGLITPTSLERVMQIAYTAKMNSGCISRQVGAVVTDENFSIKSVGWNDTAHGQIPCNLRSLDGLKSSFDPVVYSQFERNDESFRGAAEQQRIKLVDVCNDTGRNNAYCFKSIKNRIDDEKNQVHTRSLHAEENAFLQLTKYGGMGVEGGKLFTTASPCELCSKKAYQLGIKEVVFIDPYPGIAIDHILNVGSNPPKLTQFRGAVGRGYHQLYESIMPYKDELNFLGG